MRTIRAVTVMLVLLLLVAACGSTNPENALEPTAATPPAVATPSPAITPTPTPTPTATPSPTPAATPAVAEPTPTASMMVGVTGDPVGIPDMRDLVWVSTLIVHGTIAEKLPSQRFPAVDGPLGTMTPQNYYDTHIYTDYVIAVDQVFRGNPTDRVTLRQVGGRVGDAELVSTNDPELHPGDDLVLFLTPDYPDSPGDAFWPAGDFQGIWLPDGDEYAPYHGLMGPLD
ncbi:MAG TPA: hypothetical protein VHA53_03315, partial [Nitrolancea sp.]|nr:hypothetical protein [Nitrolancea sp.]